MPLTTTPKTAVDVVACNTRDTRGRQKKNHNNALTATQPENIAEAGTSSNAAVSLGSIEFLIKKVASDLSDKIENVRDDFQRQIDSLRESFNQLIDDNISSKISSLRETAALQEARIDFLERQLHANDIVINGVPCSGDENLTDVFGTMCNSLNITTPQVHDIFRIRNTNNPDSSIIVKLTSTRDKVNILKAISLKHKSSSGGITLRDLGFDSSRRVFLHESLTKKNYVIFREAYRLKRAGRLVSVHTKKGIVYIKTSSRDLPQPVNDIAILQHLAATMNE